MITLLHYYLIIIFLYILMSWYSGYRPHPAPFPEGLIRVVGCDVTGGSWEWQLTWAWGPWQDAYHSTFAKQAKAAPASHQPPPPQAECQRRSSAFTLVALWSWQWSAQNSSVGQTREHQSCLSLKLWHSRHQKEEETKKARRTRRRRRRRVRRKSPILYIQTPDRPLRGCYW